MATRTTVSERLTHKYRNGWSDLDAWGRSYPVKVLGTPRCVQEPDGYDNGGELLFTVVAQRGAPDLSRAIVQSMTASGCHHEHDCCGCASTHATVIRRRGRTYTVRISTRYNY